MTEILNCAAADELLPGSLLDALEVDEAVALAAHLRICARCRAELDSLRPALEALALSPAQTGTPSLQIKQRLMSQVRVSKQPQRVQSKRWVFRPVAALVPAAIALALVVVLSSWALSLQSQVGDQQVRLDRLTQWRASIQDFFLPSNFQTMPVKFEPVAASATGTLYVSNNRVALAVQGLASVQGSAVYQCWWINSANEVVAGGTFKIDASGSGLWVWDRPTEADEYRSMAVTLESRSGLTKAEGPLILKADF